MHTLTILFVIFCYTSVALMLGMMLGKRLKKMRRQISQPMSPSQHDLPRSGSGTIIRQFPVSDFTRTLDSRTHRRRSLEKHGKSR